MFPKGSRFIRFNTNDKGEAAVLDMLLNGDPNDSIGINGAEIPVSKLEIVHFSFQNNVALVIVAPVKEVVKPQPTKASNKDE